ncbi:MAG: MATE family efflux transporter [Erysipelotrichaceae bacterium]
MKTNKNKTLFQLAWPLFFEIAFMMLFGVVDTMMLSRFSDSAVAAVGISNNILNFVAVFLNVVAAGVAVVIAQYIGANQEEKAKKVAINAVLLNLGIGVAISLILLFFHNVMLQAMNTPTALLADARSYILILGSTIFINSLIGVAGAILRAYGHTKIVMKVSMVSNLVNITGNFILIFGMFGFPRLGVVGAATSTLLSRIVLLSIAFMVLLRQCNIHLFQALKERPIKEYVLAIVRIGLPRALENFSWNAAQLVITAFVALLSAEMITTRVYISNITMFSFLITMAIGQAAQIKIGYLVGENRMQEAYKQGIQAALFGLVSSFVSIVLITLNYRWIFSLLTRNPEILDLIQPILMVCIFLELGRAANIIIISMLTGAGDANFPVLMAVVFMWGIAVPFSYLFGLHLGWGLFGIYVGTAMDECLRGAVMWLRWISKRWTTKRIRV